MHLHVKMRSHQQGRVLCECVARQFCVGLKVAIEVRGQKAQASAMAITPRTRVGAVFPGQGDPVDQGARKDPKHMGIRERRLSFVKGHWKFNQALGICEHIGSAETHRAAAVQRGAAIAAPRKAQPTQHVKQGSAAAGRRRAPQGPKRHDDKGGNQERVAVEGKNQAQERLRSRRPRGTYRANIATENMMMTTKMAMAMHTMKTIGIMRTTKVMGNTHKA